MLITAIEPRRKAMSALYIDGEFVMNLDTQTLIENRFDVGREIDDEDLHEIIKLSNERRAKEKAANKAVERMEELGLVNDENYARRYAQQLLFSKHMAPKGAVHALVQKGIDRELANDIIEEIPVDIDESIRTVIDKKYRNIKRRAVAALQRLGYRWDEIKNILEEYTEEDYI